MPEHESVAGALVREEVEVNDETEFFHEIAWCPDCQSPPTSDYAHVQYCNLHEQDATGSSDRLIANDYIARGEAGGEDNRAVCAFLHRDRKESK